MAGGTFEEVATDGPDLASRSDADLAVRAASPGASNVNRQIEVRGGIRGLSIALTLTVW
jgi:hypothetical protein